MNSETPTIQKLRPRPLSPHLQVYSWLITSTTSILHRLTGVILSVGLLLFTYWLAVLAFMPEQYDCLSECLRSPLGYAGLAGLSASIYYHLLNGIRHLLWDAGYGFEVKTINKTGPLVIISTAILTLITWMAVI